MNNDRAISKDEFITHMNLTTHTENNNWIALFKELDTNGDGVLTYQEFWEKDSIRNSENLMEALNEFVVSKPESFRLHYVIFESLRDIFQNQHNLSCIKYVLIL